MRCIISEKHEFIYFIVEKVACTSIKIALAPLFGINATGVEIPREGQNPRYGIHEIFWNSGHEVSKKKLLEKLDGPYSGYFKFAFVRNPWDRLVSCYTDKIVGEGRRALTSPRGSHFYKGMPFDEFVEVVCATPDNKANIHFRSQHRKLCGPEGELLPDFIGRFENLAEDFAHVATTIGAQDLVLPHLWRSKEREGRPYTEFYDARLKGMVAERYRRDARIFDYSF